VLRSRGCFRRTGQPTSAGIHRRRSMRSPRAIHRCSIWTSQANGSRCADHDPLRGDPRESKRAATGQSGRCRAAAMRILDVLKRVALIVLALLTFLPSMVRAAASFECAMDGEVRLSCCCPKPKGARQDSEQHLEPACCCKITQMRAAEPAPRGEPVVTFEAGPPVIVPRTIVLLIATPVHIVALGPVRSPRGPPGPLFVWHCSLLI